jgi:hypothetical protein
MGGSLSRSSDMSTPAVLNFIFQEMFQRSNMADLYALSDPKKCSQMVILGAEALETHFVGVKIHPYKKDGTLYFQSLPGFKTEMSAEAAEEHKQNCKELAFYFIRIFQIFAALTLTILDTELPVANPSDNFIRDERARQGSYVNPKESPWKGYAKKPSLFDRLFTSQKGGQPGRAPSAFQNPTAGTTRAAAASAAAAAAAAGPQAPAASVPTRVPSVGFTAIPEGSSPSLPKTPGPLPSKYISFIQFLDEFGNFERSQIAKGKIRGTPLYVKKDSNENEPAKIIFVGANKLQISCDVSVEQGKADGDFIVQVDFTRGTVRPVEREGEFQLPTKISITFRLSKNEFTYYSRRKPEPKYEGYTVPEYLARVFEKIVRNRHGSYSRTRRTQQGLRKPEENSSTPEGFKVRKLFDALGRTPPIKAHCVARAMQLLDVNAIRGQIGEKTFSSACRINFAYQRDGSLPTPGKDITNEIGIYALMRLFYDGLQGSMPSIINTEEYANFKETLKAVFEAEKPSVETGEEEDATPIQQGGQIAVQNRPTFCGSGDSTLQIPRDLAYQLRSVSQRLLQQQMQHVRTALNIIFKLFDQHEVVNNRKFAMSSQIIEGGMEAINRIASEARTVLLEYYKGCEMTYRDGLQKLYAYNEKRPLVLSGVNGRVNPNTTRRQNSRRGEEREENNENDLEDENENIPEIRYRERGYDKYGRPQTPYPR